MECIYTKKVKLSAIFGLLSAIFGLLLCFPVHASSSILNEDFDSYNLGSIFGQGNWWADTPTANNFQVSSDAGHLSAQGLDSNIAHDYRIWKSFTNLSDASSTYEMSFWLSLGVPAPSSTLEIWLMDRKGGGEYQWQNGAYMAQIVFRANGTFGLLNDLGIYIIAGLTPTDDAWHEYTLKLQDQFQWLKLDDNNYNATSYRRDLTDDLTHIQQIVISQSANNVFYLDSFSGGATSTYPEPYTPEDCSSYDLLQRLTCEIKNFFGGAFIPSTAKRDELKNTLDSVSQRVPYTYIVKVKDMFSSISSQTASSSPLSLTFLGRPLGNVNFNFFDIDISGESLGLRLRDYFSIFITIGFIAWAIYFLKTLFK